MAYGSYSYGSPTYGGAIAFAPLTPGVTKIRPKVLLRYGRINEPVRVPIYDLLVDSESTYLTVDANIGSTSLTVRNISSFGTRQILLIGSPGQEGSEIIHTDSALPPSGFTIPLNSPTTQPHGANTPVYIINFDEIEYSVAQTLDGPKSILGILPIKADNLETNWDEPFINTGFYFARWRNSINYITINQYSPYSDGVPMISYTKYMARSIIQGALNEIGKDTSDILTDEYAFQQINLCQEEVLSEQKRWSFMEKFGSIIGQAIVSGWKVEAPEDLPEDQTNKFVYNFKLGIQPAMTWIDKDQMDKFLEEVGYSTLKNPIYIGDASIALENSGDFEDAGTILIGGKTFTYTANDRVNGVLTLQTVSLDAFPQGMDGFQGAEIGHPLYWTSYGGFIYHYPINGPKDAGRPYKMDYYRAATVIKRDIDEIVFPDAALAQYYLEWKFLLKLNKGQESANSEVKMQLYADRLKKLIAKNSLGRTFRLRPRMNNWAQQESFGVEGESLRNKLGNFPNV